jgi:hypothetical protein
MKKIAFFIIGGITFSSSLLSQVIFSDDFNGTTLNSDLWDINCSSIGGLTNQISYIPPQDQTWQQCWNDWALTDYNVGGVGCYDNANNVLVHDGMLELKLTYDHHYDCPVQGEKWFKDAQISSKRRFKTGIFEARIRMDASYNGGFSAFWLFGVDDPNPYPTGTEIDIEYNTHWNERFNTDFHYYHNGSDPSDPDQGQVSSNSTQHDIMNIPWWVPSSCIEELNINSTIDSWHTYKIIWGDEHIKIYIDDALIRDIFPGPYDDNDLEYQPIAATSIVFDLVAHAGSCIGSEYCDGILNRFSPLYSSDFPKSMFVDWVKVTTYESCDSWNENISLCNYEQNWGHSPNAYFGKTITAGGPNCTFSFDQVDPPYFTPKDELDFFATDQIALLGGFQAHPGSEFSARIVASNCDNQRSSIASNEKIHSGEQLNDRNYHWSFNSASIYPNPNTGVFTLSIQSDMSANPTLYLVDPSGRIIHAQSVILHDGLNQIQLSKPELSSGIYFIKVDGVDQMEKIIITH